MNELNLYFVKRIRLLRTGIQDICIIGAVAADSPAEALDVAYKFFPQRPQDTFHVKPAKGASETMAAKKFAEARVKDNWEFRAIMTMETYQGECA